MSCASCGCDPEADRTCQRHQQEANGHREGNNWLIPETSTSFVVKDSGARQSFESGMVRDTTTDKVDYSLVFDGPMLDRWAVHLTKGAVKYSSRNWLKANGQEELDRFKASAARHFFQWMRGDVDEDHAAAVFFNLNGHAYVQERMK